MTISIHTFLAEGDGLHSYDVAGIFISIHTFLAEGDPFTNCVAQFLNHFNPHLPCGRRLTGYTDEYFDYIFQSTPSLRKAT